MGDLIERDKLGYEAAKKLADSVNSGDLVERLRMGKAAPDNSHYLMQRAADEIEHLTAACSDQVNAKMRLGRENRLLNKRIEELEVENEFAMSLNLPNLYNEALARIERLERVLEAATNLVRAEGWQIERDNLWDTLHDLIDAEDEAIAEVNE